MKIRYKIQVVGLWVLLQGNIKKCNWIKFGSGFFLICFVVKLENLGLIYLVMYGYWKVVQERNKAIRIVFIKMNFLGGMVGVR